MVMNECAYYGDKLWYAYELKDGNGQYKEEERLFMRKESQDHKFSCPDCGEELILCAGPIMEPFFKHHELSQCLVRQVDSKHRNMVVRRMMFHLAKNSFPDGYIEANRKIGEHASADFLVTTEEGTMIALNYLGYEMKLSAWEEIHEEYEENEIEDIWFLNHRKYQNAVSTTFEYLLTKNKRPIILINDEEQTITLKQRMESPSGGMYFFARTYELSEILIGSDGAFLTDFSDFCQSEMEEINAKEEREVLEAEEKARIIAQETEDMARRKQEKDAFYLRQERQILNRKNEDITVSYSSIPMIEGVVVRRSMSEGPVKPKEMKMRSLEEYWRLPDLQGKEWVIKRADMLRFGFLKNLDQELTQITNIEEKESKIREAISILERSCNASVWK